MCIVCALPCCWPDGSYDTPLFAATISFLRSRGDIIPADQAFPRPVNPEYAQHPPDCVVDYWFHRLGLSFDIIPAETPSNFPTLPSPLPVFDDIDPSAPLRTSTIVQQSPSNSTREYQGPSEDLPSPPDQGDHKQPQPHDLVRNQLRVVPTQRRLKHKVYDSPGKKPGAEYEPDPIKLQASCQLRGGTEFACQWILTAFKGGVTLEALVRRLKLTEIEHINFPGGFKLALVYDGFPQKADDGFECCLCPVDKKVWWKNKKDAIRHLRKFHFGLADQCDACHKRVYSTGEMNSHRCVPQQNLPTPATVT